MEFERSYLENPFIGYRERNFRGIVSDIFRGPVLGIFGISLRTLQVSSLNLSILTPSPPPLGSGNKWGWASKSGQMQPGDTKPHMDYIK